MTRYYAGIGDDGRVHHWRHAAIEEMTRVCDGVQATNVDVWTRDKDSDRVMCAACEEGRR